MGGVTYSYNPNQALDGTPAKGACYYGSGTYVTYTNGSTTQTQSAAPGAIPINQIISSAAAPLPGDSPSEIYFRADGAANDQGLFIQPGGSGTLSLAKPTAMGHVYFFASSGNSPANATGTVTVNFLGGKTESFSYNAGDWATNVQPTAFAGGGLGRDYSAFTTPWAPAVTTGFNIFQTGIDLGTGSLGSAAYSLPVSSFTFTAVGSNPFEYTAIFDVSATPEPGLPALLVGMMVPGAMLLRKRKKAARIQAG
jgi:hypothetical protein